MAEREPAILAWERPGSLRHSGRAVSVQDKFNSNGARAISRTIDTADHPTDGILDSLEVPGPPEPTSLLAGARESIDGRNTYMYASSKIFCNRFYDAVYFTTVIPKNSTHHC